MSKRIRKKKAVIVTLAATLALTAALPAGVYAEAVQVGEGSSSAGGSASNAPVKGESPVDAKVTKEKAVSLSRKYASIPDDYVLQNASYTTETLARGKRTQWHLSFVKRVNNKFIGEISTRIDAANGNLLGFHTYVNDPTRKAVYPPKVSREQAKELALKFIAQVNPQYKDQLLYNEDYGAQFRPPLNEEVRYAIRYNRVVNDIAYMDNYIDIEMDGEGHVYQFNVKWDETIEFEQSKPGITAEEALQQFRKEAELELIYTIPYEMTKKREPMLRYEMQPFMLDAVKGGRWIGFAEPASPIALKPVSEEPLGEKPEEGKSLTAEQAAELVIEAFSVDKEAVLRDSSYSEYTDPATGKTSASWNIGWEIKGGDENTRSVWASVNSDTGEIRHYSAYTDWRNTEREKG